MKWTKLVKKQAGVYFLKNNKELQDFLNLHGDMINNIKIKNDGKGYRVYFENEHGRFHDNVYVHQASEKEYATLQTLADQLQAMYPNHHIVAIDNMIEWDLSTDDGSSLNILIMEDDEGNISSSILKVSYDGEPEEDSHEKQYNGNTSSIAQQIQNEIEKFM